VYDERDPKSGTVTRPGIVDHMPDIEALRQDVYSVSVSNEQHYETIRQVYERYGIVLDPHGSVGWKSLEKYNGGKHDRPAVVYETADPGKFPEDIEKAIDITPQTPPGIRKQESLPERVYEIEAPPAVDPVGQNRMDSGQYNEVRKTITGIFG
jgi:threonine synthase